MGNIYDIAKFVTTSAYSVNDIVYNNDDERGMPSGYGTRAYFYSKTAHPASITYPWNDGVNWGGWIYNITAGRHKPYFFWTPSYNVQSNHEPRVKKISLGDGYEQRVKDGINNTKLDLQLSFELRSQVEATAILHFLEARGGHESFVFTPTPPFNKQLMFVCGTWNSTYNFFDNYTVSAKFIEVSAIN